MSRHEAITKHTFRTDGGIIVTIDFANERLQKMDIQFPGSGNVAKPLSMPILRELAEVAADANKFLVDQGITGARSIELEPAIRLG